MEINIEHFRNLHNRKFTFHEGLNLLSGNNGKGKSNLLACIEWVLYGSCQGGSVLPRGKKKASAILHFPDKKLTIERRKGPELLLLWLEGKEGKEEYKDNEASQLINAYFGSPEVWRATCFVPQESRCPLLSGTKEQQINTLNALIFSNSDPSVIQKKIDGKRKEEEQDVKVIKGKIDGLTQGLSFSLSGENEGEITSQNIKMFILYLQQQHKDLEEWERKRFQLDFQLNSLHQERKDLENELKVLPEVKDEEFFQLQREIEQMKQMLPHLQMMEQFQQKIKSLEAELFSLSSSLPSHPDEKKREEKGESPTEEEFNRLKIQEYQYSENKAKCDKLGISYDEHTIQERRDFLQELLAYFPTAKKVKELKAEIHQFLSLLQDEAIYKQDKNDELMLLEREIFQHEQNKDTLECPSCKKALVFSKNKLHPSDGFVVDSEHLSRMNYKLVELRLYEKKRKELETYRKALDERQTLLKEFSPHIKEAFKSVGNISVEINDQILQQEEAMKHQLFLLQNIKLVEKPFPSEEYRKLLRRHQIQLELNEWKEKTKGSSFLSPSSSPSFSSELVREELRKNENKFNQWNISKVRKEELEKKKGEVEKRLEKINPMENKEKELKEAKEGLGKLQEKYERLRLTEEMQEKKKVLDEYKEEVEKKQERVSKIEVLKEICRKVQSERIDVSLYSLNAVTNEILKEMFEEPISIEIKATKETKQGKIKNELALVINHNHEVLTTLRPDLSVGQANRVSMALSFALFLLTPCPFILLDEPFAPVDKEMIDQTLSAIKDCLPKGRTCIITAHDPNGLYDHEVHLS